LRKLIIAATALAAAAPAAAQPRQDPRPDPRDEAIVRALPHPEQIERLGETMERVTEALMDVDVGPIVDAVEGRRHSSRHRGETLGEIATRDDRYARERVREQVGAATVGVAAAVGQMAVLTPILRQSLEDAARRMEDAMRRGRERRYEPGGDRDHEDRGADGGHERESDHRSDRSERDD
jgi:hypothetical protein